MNTYEIDLNNVRTIRVLATDLNDVYVIMDNIDDRAWYGIRPEEKLIGPSCIRRTN